MHAVEQIDASLLRDLEPLGKFADENEHHVAEGLEKNKNDCCQ